MNTQKNKYQKELIQGKKSIYWEQYWNCFFEFQEKGEKQAGLAAYKELHYCVYSCPTYLFSAFDKPQEVCALVELIKAVAKSAVF